MDRDVCQSHTKILCVCRSVRYAGYQPVGRCSDNAEPYAAEPAACFLYLRKDADPVSDVCNASVDDFSCASLPVEVGEDFH